jgi:hypothetical protein
VEQFSNSKLGGGGVYDRTNHAASLFRATEWWGYKIAPVLGIFYATVLRQGEALASRWFSILELVGALVAGAVFVSLLNDYTDRNDDRKAGKANRLEAVPKAQAFGLIAFAVSVGMLFLWQFSDRPLIFGTYVVGWVTFALYSLPPFRLKARATFGALADAGGSHVIPALLAVFVAQSATTRIVDSAWVVAVLLWSAAFGMRGIVWHQLLDEENDRRSGLQTFVVRRPWAVRPLIRWIAFPIELVSLAAMLVLIGSSAPLFAFAIYALFLLAKIGQFGQQPMLVRSGPRTVLVMNEYYELFLPVALLIHLVTRNPADVWVLAAHTALFSGMFAKALRDLGKVLD